MSTGATTTIAGSHLRGVAAAATAKATTVAATAVAAAESHSDNMMSAASTAVSRSRILIKDLPDPLPAYPSEEVACHADILSVGMQPMEPGTLLLRVVCTIVAASIISAWWDKRKVKRLLLFFAHWVSGLLYLLLEWLMATMILACWSTDNTVAFIKFLKFLELSADNMLVITNLAICVNLAAIVANAHTMTPVRSVSSPQLILSFVAVSAVVTAASIPFWGKNLRTTGTQYWLENGNGAGAQQWVTVSQFFLELASGFVMLVIVAGLLAFRRPELRQCWSAHRRIKYYFCLSCTAAAVNLAVGIGGVLWVSYARDPRFIVVGWSMRHVHIALDTLVLYGVLVKPVELFFDLGMQKTGDKEKRIITGLSPDYTTTNRQQQRKQQQGRMEV